MHFELFPKAPSNVFSLKNCQIQFFTLYNTSYFPYITYIIYINFMYVAYIIYIYINFNQLHLHYITYIIYINFIYITYIIYIINTICRCPTSTNILQNPTMSFTKESLYVITREFLHVVTQELLHRGCHRSCYTGVVTQELTSR